MSASAGTGADYGATGGAASAAPGAASGGAAGGALTTLIPEDKKHPLYRPWTYWELRSKDKSQGIYSWQDQPTDLFTFETVEDFWSFWKRAPKISEVFDGSGHEPARIEREEVAAGGRSRTVTTKAEAYMLFRKGVAPMTEAERSPGVRWTVNRRRAELSVRPKDFDSWWGAWETTVQAIIGEIIDPDEYIVGAYLTDKVSAGVGGGRHHASPCVMMCVWARAPYTCCVHCLSAFRPPVCLPAAQEGLRGAAPRALVLDRRRRDLRRHRGRARSHPQGQAA